LPRKFRFTGRPRRSAPLLLVRASVVYVPGILTHPHKPYDRTSGFELLAMAAACPALLLEYGVSNWRSRGLGAAGRAGQIVFAAALVVSGVQHFMYANFVATLVPSWIPARSFWAISVGAAFVAAAVSILAQRPAPLATFLMGTMFLLWVLIPLRESRALCATATNGPAYWWP